MATLRRQILLLPETAYDLALAAQERFAEAETLLGTRQYSGAVYFFGLSCEIALKLSCFKARNLPLSTDVQAQLGFARWWMRTYLPHVGYEGFHSLQFWVEYLIGLRASTSKPIPAVLVGEARHHVVHRLYEDWKIDLRYRGACITERQAHRVYQDAGWLRYRVSTDWR